MRVQTANDEFTLGAEEFERMRAFLRGRTGIHLGEDKRALVYGRLARRLRVLGLSRFADYLELVEAPGSSEVEEFTNALTTNVTAFFREPHHFELLKQTILPELWRRHAKDRRVRLWSAGCSTGEEPYTLAMTVREALPSAGVWDVRILATDLDSSVLSHARAGIYRDEALDSVGRERAARFFQRGTGAQAGHVRVKPEVARLVTFKQLNLIQDWPMQGRFDVILCRNVVIYFDDETKRRLVRRFADLLEDHGHLFLGHAESLVSSGASFTPQGHTVYSKSVGGARR